MNWLTFVLVFGVGGGLLACWILLMSHREELRERRKLEIHRWALDEDRELLKRASMTPMLYKGYRLPKRDDQ